MMFWKRSLDTTTAPYPKGADPRSPNPGMPHKHAWDVNFWPEWDDPDDPPGSFSMRAYQWAMGILKKPCPQTADAKAGQHPTGRL